MSFIVGFFLLLVAIITDVLGIEAPAGMEEDIERFDRWLGDDKSDE